MWRAGLAAAALALSLGHAAALSTFANKLGGDQTRLLNLVADTDRGADASALPPEKREGIYSAYDGLVDAGAGNSFLDGPEPPALGNFEVVFVGPATAAQAVGQTKA
eukprot:CAMPEP_0118878982 /NCGR_PEP_ID=MMETSP1163-20130328/18840_1 /TAXON_ID=124430 /ORGANISM="Phaeomonas parva, Strain CCMP2877" /LENGTH=106 /DNA_ID=CAMNT_0006814979 /DNA_START=112 /DNA_END=428 /DNA_ORIENTATION=+